MEGVDDGLEREGGNAVADDQPNAGGEEEERADDAAYGWCQLKLLGISKALSLKSSSLFRSFPTNERWWPHCGHEPKRAVEKCVREEGSGRTDRATSRVPERDPDEPIAQPPGTDCVRARSGRTDLETQTPNRIKGGSGRTDRVPNKIESRIRTNRSPQQIRYFICCQGIRTSRSPRKIWSALGGSGRTDRNPYGLWAYPETCELDDDVEDELVELVEEYLREPPKEVCVFIN